MSAGANQRPPLSDLPMSKSTSLIALSVFEYSRFCPVSDLKMMFEPNRPLKPMPKVVKRQMPPYTGISNFLKEFEIGDPPSVIKSEDLKERKARRVAEQMALNDAQTMEQAKLWDPTKNPKATE